MSEDLYWRLHALSKCLESSGRIDEHDMPDAYATILDAMNAVRPSNVADPFTQVIQHLNSNPYNLTKDECIELVKNLRDKNE